MRTFILVSLVLLLPSLAGAEEIRLKSGVVKRGEIVEKTDTDISLQSGGSTLTIPFHMIAPEQAAELQALPNKTAPAEPKVPEAAVTTGLTRPTDAAVAETAGVVSGTAPVVAVTVPLSAPVTPGAAPAPTSSRAAGLAPSLPEAARGAVQPSGSFNNAAGGGTVSPTGRYCSLSRGKRMSPFGPLLWLTLILFGGLVFPIWMLIQCATSSVQQGTAKVIWLVAIFFTGPLGAVAYGLFGCERRSAAWFGAVAVIVLALLSIPPALNMLKMMKQALAAEIGEIDRYDTHELSVSQREALKSDMQMIMEDMRFGNRRRLRAALELSKLFYTYARDKRITLEEYKAWMDKFDSRYSISDRDN